MADVAQRLGASGHSLYAGVKLYSESHEPLVQDDDQQSEVCKLLAELRREMEERGILKMGAAYFAKQGG